MPIPQDSTASLRSLLRDQVYERLRDAIVDGTFEPDETLRDSELATWLGVSRTPVREALLRLSEAGLVVARPGQSTRVASLDLRAIRDAQAVVASMHELAVREAVPQMTATDIKIMKRANRRFAQAIRKGDVEAALAADDEFHEVPVACAANNALRSVLAQFTPAVRRLERARFATLAGRASIKLHDRMVERCAAGDAEGAAAIACETWQSLDPLADLDEICT